MTNLRPTALPQYFRQTKRLPLFWPCRPIYFGRAVRAGDALRVGRAWNLAAGQSWDSHLEWAMEAPVAGPDIQQLGWAARVWTAGRT